MSELNLSRPQMLPMTTLNMNGNKTGKASYYDTQYPGDTAAEIAFKVSDELQRQGISCPGVEISAQTDTDNNSRLVITASADGQSIIGSNTIDTNSIKNALIDALPVGTSVTVGDGNIIVVLPK